MGYILFDMDGEVEGREVFLVRGERGDNMGRLWKRRRLLRTWCLQNRWGSLTARSYFAQLGGSLLNQNFMILNRECPLGLVTSGRVRHPRLC